MDAGMMPESNIRPKMVIRDPHKLFNEKTEARGVCMIPSIGCRKAHISKTENRDAIRTKKTVSESSIVNIFLFDAPLHLWTLIDMTRFAREAIVIKT
jgi:hypothetical protein